MSEKSNVLWDFQSKDAKQIKKTWIKTNNILVSNRADRDQSNLTGEAPIPYTLYTKCKVRT